MATFTSFRKSNVPQVCATILTPVSRSYGSLDLEKLKQLNLDFAELAKGCADSTIIVDLSGVKLHGSGFLSELIAFADNLQQRDIELIVSGDQTGLVSLVGAAAWCRVADDLVEALNFCASVLVLC